MLRRILLNIFQNEYVAYTIRTLSYVVMAIAIMIALLMADAQEIEFVYANF